MAEDISPESAAPVPDVPINAPSPETTESLDEDPKTDALVDDIQRKNSDAELAAAFVPPAEGRPSLWQRYLNHKKWSMPLTALLLIVLVIFALPVSRYKALGLIIKKSYTITVTDSTTGTPVSKATVQLGSQSGQTNAGGKITFKKVTVGSTQVTISKQYYRKTMMREFVGLASGKNNQKLLLEATGRQVSLSVVNKITGQPVSGAEIKALGSSARTDKTGSAILVLPANHKTATAIISGDNYVTSNGTLQITTSVVAANTFSLVPSGRAYFLSNASGKVDVMSANYDGSDRQTLLAGTGSEDTAPTRLYPSPDQKSLALITRRSGTSDALGLYNIATATGKLTEIVTPAHQNLTAVGWSNGSFVYFAQNYDAQSWQPAQQALRSYTASNLQVNELDQSDASGSGYADELYQQFSQPIAIVDGSVVYAKSWAAGYTSASQLATKTNAIYSVQPNGTNKKSLKDLTPPANATYAYIGQNMAGPHLEYFASPTTNSNDYSQGALFFKYSKGSLTALNNFTADDYNNPRPKGYIASSPSGTSLLYADSVDGQTVASVSDQSGTKQRLVALHGVGTVQGWLSDDYILVSQDNSQLYVVSADPTNKKAQPLALASFYTPPQYR
jgi:hypothetical protein